MRPLRFTLLVLCAATFVSHGLHAQGGGPLQPEFTSAPVPAGPNVDDHTGDFTYGLPLLTVPGPNGSGYSLTLSYQAGSSPDNVSWVGYGWGLNVGAVVRQKRGLPDDWEGDVEVLNKTPANYTVIATYASNTELASTDFLIPKVGGGFSYGITKRFNSQTGYSSTPTIGVAGSIVGNTIGASYSFDDDEPFQSFVSLNLLSTGLHATGTMPEASKGKKTFWQTAGDRMLGNLIGSVAGFIPLGSFESSYNPPANTPLSGTSDNYKSKFTLTVSQGVVSGVDWGVEGNKTVINTQARTTLRGYGYLLSHKAHENPSAMMDYYYETATPFTLKDRFLPLASSNADLFSITGGGTFRAWNKGVGTFQPNTVVSHIDVDNAGVDAIGGAGWGIGARWGDGQIEMSSGAWYADTVSATYGFAQGGDEPYFFRFLGDRGGELAFDRNDSVASALLRRSIEVDSTIGSAFYPEPDNTLGIQLLEGERPGRSSYVAYTTNDEMNAEQNGVFYRSFNRNDRMNVLDFDRQSLGEQIGEFALYGAGGSRYVYGLPVYASDEKDLILGIPDIRLKSPSSVGNNRQVYTYTTPEVAPTVLGQERARPYASAWLLTEITTPDYLDLTGDGPTADDPGGWTRFHYTRTAGDLPKEVGDKELLYAWRVPYNGMDFGIGALADPKDDVGSYQQGLREQYYLQSIETKTHIAVFVVGQRKDAYPQSLLHYFNPTYPTASGAAYDENDDPLLNKSYYLDRIELYTKNALGNPDELLTTVHLDYDYSLRGNMPGSLPVHPDSTTRHGMLTLRKVWVERRDVAHEKITPYIFGYDYRTSEDYAASVRGRYPEIAAYADSLTAADQNPDWSINQLDRWGHYRADGAARDARMNPWVDQTPDTHFDPAAWQLKWVRSPSGGELHVQYEQDDYAYVHDRPALAMVSLRDSVGGSLTQKSKDLEGTNKYFLNLNDLGVDSSDYLQVAKVRESIEKYGEKVHKLFFRFLYALKGDSARIDGSEYNSEYIEGYATAYQVGIETLNAGAPNEWYAIYVRLEGEDENFGVPRQICLNHVKKQTRGRLDPEEGIVLSNAFNMITRLLGESYDFTPEEHCKDIDYPNSYIRIPVIAPKKGGGLRVKRLLAYDPGVEGDSVLYGTEYRYEIEDRERGESISSGVASNEPALGRSENALVYYSRWVTDPDMWERTIAGMDRAKNEAPIGESLLPSAGVGYSRVVSHSIHQGKTSTGFSVRDYHTWRDWPYDRQYASLGKGFAWTDLDMEDSRSLPLVENLILFRNTYTKIYAAQGYRFIVSALPGSMKRSLSVGGTYSSDESDWMIGAMTEYDYFAPGDSIPLLCRPGDSLRFGYPGREMEVTQAARQQRDYVDDGQIEGDVGFWFTSGFGYVSIDDNILGTHVTTKVIRYPAIVKGVKTYADGTYRTVENVAFNPMTGAPIVTRATDGFNGLDLDLSPGEHGGAYHSYAFPAPVYHPETGRKSDNERALLRSEPGREIVKFDLTDGRAFIELAMAAPWYNRGTLSAGDLVKLTLKSPGVGVDSFAGFYHVDSVVAGTAWLDHVAHLNPSTDTALSNGGEVHVEIVRSGRANLHGTYVGGLTTYGESEYEALFGSNFNFIGTGALGRNQLVGALNTLMLGGGGAIYPPSLAPGLKLQDKTGECVAPSDSIYLSIAGSQVLLGFQGRRDTMSVAAGPGTFDLDDAGFVVWRGAGEQCCTRRVNAVIPCGDTVFRVVANVVAASAMEIGDYTEGAVPDSVLDGSAYERGERGKWRPRASWAYRTSVTEGSRPVAGERVYTGGIFDDFSLFNWMNPGQSDGARWFRLDTVTRYDRHGRPVERRDILGRPSTVVYEYGEDRDALPELLAWNAGIGSVEFEGFEMEEVGVSSAGAVDDSLAHSGNRSRLVYNAEPGELLSVRVNEQVRKKGLIVRMWGRSAYHGGLSGNLEAGSLSLATGIDVLPIARAGEWTLHEAVIDGADVDAGWNDGDTMTFSFEYNFSSDSMWIDDVVVYPADAVVSSGVYDPELYLPLAGFDADHFGLYPVYDAEKRPFAAVVETARGRMTVGEVYGNVPGVERDWLGGDPGTQLTYGGSPSLSLGAPSSEYDDPSGKPSGAGGSFDILSLELGLDRRELTVFGVDASRLRDVLRERLGDFQELTREEEDLVKEYASVAERHRALADALAAEADPDRRLELEREIAELRDRQGSVLSRLGLSREEIEGKEEEAK